MPFNINNCQILQIGPKNRKMNYIMRGVKIKSIQLVRDLDVTVSSNLKFSRQCNEAVKKANRKLGLLKRNFSFKNKNIVYTAFI